MINRRDYQDNLINSERCLQSAKLSGNLSNKLDVKYTNEKLLNEERNERNNSPSPFKIDNNLTETEFIKSDTSDIKVIPMNMNLINNKHSIPKENVNVNFDDIQNENIGILTVESEACEMDEKLRGNMLIEDDNIDNIPNEHNTKDNDIGSNFSKYTNSKDPTRNIKSNQ